MFGLVAKLGSALARKGIIRGTAGKMLGGRQVTKESIDRAINPMAAASIPGWPGQPPGGGAMPSFRPGVGMVVRGGQSIVRGGMGAAAGGAVVAGGRSVARRYSKKVAALIASGLLFEAGGKLFNTITGKENKETRRMNYANGRALKRAIRRFDGAAKQYAKVLKATQGTKKCGYTVTARRPKKRCA